MDEFAGVEARIRQLHAHYTDAVWRKDPESFGGCFAADAEWRISGMVLSGREAIVAAFGGICANMERVLISFRTPQVELTGSGTAAARVYVTEHCTWTNKAPNFNIGRYFERYVDCGGRWRFSWRLYHLLYTGASDLSGQFHDHPDFGAWPGMPPADAVPEVAPGKSIS